MSDVRFLLKKAVGGNEIEIKDDLSAGRGLDNGLKLTEGNPSRHHARFTISDGALYLEDLKSTNGTFVNGTRIDRRMRLAPNDKIRFDLEEYVVRVEMPPPPLVDIEETAIPVVEQVPPVVEAPPSWKSLEQLEEERQGQKPTVPGSAATPMDARRKRRLLIAGLSILGALLLTVVIMKWLG